MQHDYITGFSITGINIATPAIMETATDGTPVLTFGFFAEKYVGGKGADAKYHQQYFRCTVWRNQALYLWALIKEFGGKDGKPGVGMKLNISSNSLPVSSAHARITKGEVERDPSGDVSITQSIEITVNEFQIVSIMPEGAFKRASEASKRR